MLRAGFSRFIVDPGVRQAYFPDTARQLYTKKASARAESHVRTMQNRADECLCFVTCLTPGWDVACSGWDVACSVLKLESGPAGELYPADELGQRVGDAAGRLQLRAAQVPHDVLQ